MTSRRPSVFIDSSVIIAASISSRGHARDLVVAGLRGEVALIWSDLVTAETERNLQAKAPSAVSAFHRFREKLDIEIATPEIDTIRQAEKIVDPKDAPIVAAAVAGDASWIASYDRKHLLSRRDEILNMFGMIAATPDEILTSLKYPCWTSADRQPPQAHAPIHGGKPSPALQYDGPSRING